MNDLADELAVKNQGKQYDYKVNTNLSYGFLKNRVLELLYCQAPLDKMFQALEKLFLTHTVPIVITVQLKDMSANIEHEQCLK